MSRDDRKKKKKEQARRQQERLQREQKENEIPLAWPSTAQLATRELTEAEANALAIHPMVTGIGNHPRMIPDADWVYSCQRLIEAYGNRAFASAMIRLLKMTAHLPWALPMPIDQQMTVPDVLQPFLGANLSLPVPAVEIPLEGIQPGEWTPEHVIGMTVNPIYAGLGPYPRIVPESVWVAAFAQMISRRGVLQTLVDFLYVLKHTFGAYGVSHGIIVLEPDDGDEEEP